ncbi:MAG: hypothetical protein WD060_03285 [Pirellulales bacterium]
MSYAGPACADVENPFCERGSALAGGAVLIARSPKRAFIEAYRQRQEDLAREAITRFVVRHAGDS